MSIFREICLKLDGVRFYAVGITTDPGDLKGYDNVTKGIIQVSYLEVDAKMQFMICWVKNCSKAW